MGIPEIDGARVNVSGVLRERQYETRSELAPNLAAQCERTVQLPKGF